MNNELRVILDAPFGRLLPFEYQDFSAKCILSSLYEPLFFKYKNEKEYNSYYIQRHYVIDNMVVLEFKKDIYWSNGNRITSSDIYQSLLYQIKHKTKYSYYLDFIEGVSDYLYNGREFKIGITNFDHDNKIIIYLSYHVNYYDVFSCIEFAPVYFENGIPVNTVSNGCFILSKIGTFNVIVERNPYFRIKNDFFINKINFILCKDLIRPISLFYENKIDITSATYFPDHYISLLGKDVNIDTSSILFFLTVSEDLLYIKNFLLEKMTNFLESQFNKIISMLKDYSLIDKNTYKSVIDNELIVPLRKRDVSIAYPDYYPNDIIISHLKDVLEGVGFSVSICKFDILNYISLDKDKYDIYLSLSSLVYYSELNEMIFYAKYIRDDRREEYMSLVNSYIDGDVYKEIVDRFLTLNSKIFPICSLNFTYLKSLKADAFYIDENGLYRFNLIKE
ncbi:hypothetical protein L5B97_05280 [Avibacterium sp. 20-15]|uniref:hypothetical protein n=1 Tax=unclassified Avibacterium TaxID=2685287 RepID=UPI0020265831|nr:MULTISPECIES: hypothetical protein [unclassified Avibacterium]MCW9732901.1 hypothetical protein [Avibacterium sp. 20-15]URL05036.1 hypothetical protein L4F93_03975 [Avibacterium sp. 20-132]